MYFFNFLALLLLGIFFSSAQVFSLELGIDQLFQPNYVHLVQGKRVAVLTNQTGISSSKTTTEQLFLEENKKGTCTLICFFCPEHGFRGTKGAGTVVEDEKHECGIPIYSLYGTTRRPNDAMLEGVETIVFDIQDIGCRSYTYVSTLFYVMEEAARKRIEVIVLDRPNPIGGEYVDGPMLEEKWRSFVGYVNIPYCHGMTIGELARFFNKEYGISCTLHVVPMKGWSRSMYFHDTALMWIPTSPYIPHEKSTLFYPSTGILGELSLVNIGIGYTLPFQIITAPWLEAKRFAAHLNKAKLKGVHFHETWIKPYCGLWKEKVCQGVHIVITDHKHFCPIKVFYLVLSVLREIYPSKTLATFKNIPQDSLFYKVCGTEKIAEIVQKEEHPYHALVNLHKTERADFLKKRLLYLMYE